jgi:hypothetical protein
MAPTPAEPCINVDSGDFLGQASTFTAISWTSCSVFRLHKTFCWASLARGERCPPFGWPEETPRNLKERKKSDISMADGHQFEMWLSN